MPPADDNRVQARVSPAVGAWLDNRTKLMGEVSRHLQAAAELSMWRDAQAIELRKLRFTLPQIGCIADVMNGNMLEAGLGQFIWMNLADAFAIARRTPVPDYSSYGRKWGIDEQELLDYAAAMNPVADLALREKLAVWWDDTDGYQNDVESWAKLGLTVIDPDAKPLPGRLTPAQTRTREA